ncbi:BA75_00702T0 [Komagataella pastoris]|uniref:BA75_00702T0 n=1 Tax=Komagataella pastoris TaxID=4922 RepID=A0A1B2J8S8_PICPA|nr:BA75_00702T0 [Komagataella pastoris]
MSLEDDEALFDDIYGDEPQQKDAQEVVEKETKDETKSTSDGISQPLKDDDQKKPDSSATEASPKGPSAPVLSNTSTSQSDDTPLPPPPISNSTPSYNSAPAYPPYGQQQQQQQHYQQQPQQQQQQFQQPAVPFPPAKPAPDSVKADIYKSEQGKMFIGGLNWETTEETLRNYFGQFGDITDLTIMRDNATGRSRGFGFLTFTKTASVDEVLKKQHVLDGKLIDPKRAIPREEQDKTGKIFVGGIAAEVTEEDFTDYFSQFGTIIDAQLMIDKDTGRSRGFGFVTYDSPDAVDRVCANKYVPLKGRSMEIKRAEPRNQQQNQRTNANPYNPMGAMGGMSGMPGMGAPGQQAYYNGMSQEMMQQYYQQMQQYWMQMQQMQQQQQQQQGSDAAEGEGDSESYSDQPRDDDQVPNPQQERPQFPSGPKHSSRPPPRGPRSDRGGRRGGGRGRRGGAGGGGFHPYSR